MSTKEPASEKCTAVDCLEFDGRTAKRVSWEDWEFTIIGPHLVRVTNASYGYLKDKHTYTVGVELREGLAVPAECDCPADIHREPDCKHKVSLAAVGGLTVLNAAVDFGAAPPSDESEADAEECSCDKSLLPCFDCYLAGRQAKAR